jgi:hypothetical protein
MRKLLVFLFLLNAAIFAQSVVPQALNETLNLAPRMQRGESMKFDMKIRVEFLSEDGSLTAIKSNEIRFAQLCLSNTPDSGLVHEITIDTFTIGSLKRDLKQDWDSRSSVDSLIGYHFRTSYRSKIPVKGDCYDIGIPLTTGFAYEEAWEFIDDFLPVKLMTQMQYTAGRRLAKVGDTVTISWPKPICYKVKDVIEQSRVDQKPFLLKVTGLTSYRGTPCATISFSSPISPYRVDIIPPDSSSFVAAGTALVSGEFLVSLKKGTVVYAKMSERLETKITQTGEKERQNRVVKNTELIPIVW